MQMAVHWIILFYCRKQLQMERYCLISVKHIFLYKVVRDYMFLNCAWIIVTSCLSLLYNKQKTWLIAHVHTARGKN